MEAAAEGWTKRIVSAGRDVLDLLLPSACLGCGDPIPLDRSRRLVCVRCRTALRRPPPPICDRCGLPLGTRPPTTDGCGECHGWPAALVRARSATLLRPPADRLVHALKYGGWRRLGTFMGRRMVSVGPFPENAVVVPVPTTRARRRRRGYNQAAVLAEVYSAACGRPLVRALERRPGARTQVALQPRQRGRNVRRAFSVRAEEGGEIRGRSVILIDDVLTTGATAGSAAGALAASGAASVSLLTFARAVPYRGAW